MAQPTSRKSMGKKWLPLKGGFNEVDREDVQEIFNCHKERLLNEELVQL
jgi:hypothetical protein